MLINLPDDITKIGENTFVRCENLPLLCSENSIGHPYTLAYEIPCILIGNTK